jgi:hypothetical protein
MMRIKFGVNVKTERGYFCRIRGIPDPRYSTISRSLKTRISSLLRGTEYPGIIAKKITQKEELRKSGVIAFDLEDF